MRPWAIVSANGHHGDEVVTIPRLKAVREAALLTQAELAARSGVSEVQINRIENSPDLNPRFATIKKLAAALGVEPATLMAEPVRRL
jgi:transcriptional regulator with XRE-family HTH domain